MSYFLHDFQYHTDLSVFQLTEQAVLKVAEERAEKERKEKVVADAAAAAAAAAQICKCDDENEMDVIVEEDDIFQQQSPTRNARQISFVEDDSSYRTNSNGQRMDSTNNDSMWSIFEDGPPPEGDNNNFNEEHRDDEPAGVAGIDDGDQYFEDPLFATEKEDQLEESTTIALVPMLGSNKSGMKKKKPNFRNKIKK
jgi:hypothetical protein